MIEYDETYFLRGKETGVSLYENYRWLPELTIPMVQSIINHLSLERCRILDFGCARGYVVKAFRGFDYDAYGIDISKWAIQNCDPAVRSRLNYTENSPPLLKQEFDWVLAKDVLEHIYDIEDTINSIMEAAKTGVFVVVPLSSLDGSEYVVPDYERDVTHVNRFTLETWAGLFIRPGWSVEARYRVNGVKDNYAKWKHGNGFLTCRRLSD